MSDSQESKPKTGEERAGTPDGKQEWAKPTLTVLGDAATLTEAGALATNDGQAGLS